MPRPLVAGFPASGEISASKRNDNLVWEGGGDYPVRSVKRILPRRETPPGDGHKGEPSRVPALGGFFNTSAAVVHDKDAPCSRAMLGGAKRDRASTSSRSRSSTGSLSAWLTPTAHET